MLYRRVLLHSHLNEQPFRRMGDAVKIQPQEEVIVRVHMNSSGYITMTQKGTTESVFSAIALPKNCAFKTIRAKNERTSPDC